MSEKRSIIGLLGPVIAKYPPADRTIFAALGERIAAERYRAWAAGASDPKVRDKLNACALREEDIAQRVESLRPDAAALQEQLTQDHPDLKEQYVQIFDGLALAEQYAMQAEAERAGAAAWRAFADSAKDEQEAETLRACAPLEEESASVLEELIKGL